MFGKAECDLPSFTGWSLRGVKTANSVDVEPALGRAYIDSQYVSIAAHKSSIGNIG